MIDAVFISDLHLHPTQAQIKKRFDAFINWATTHVKAVYILGDFFHAWPGDDALDAWSLGIAKQLADLATKGIKLYFLHGNRDFLVGKKFAQLAKLTILREPCIIKLGKEKILLVHGDCYCTNDRAHQWLMWLTRNRLFPKLFLMIPYSWRAKLVNKVRTRSAANRAKPMEKLAINLSSLLRHMQKLKVEVVIHGHIHKPGLTKHTCSAIEYRQYVLSDWDDNPWLMCYDSSNGFYFNLNFGD